MTRRTWMLGMAMLALTAAGGVWAGMAWANSRTSANAVPLGCSEECPPNCLSFVGAKSSDECCKACCKNVDTPACPTKCAGPCGCAKAEKSVAAGTAALFDCCDDPSCPPGCTPECAARCLPVAKTAEVKAKKDCPPCPFCP